MCFFLHEAFNSLYKTRAESLLTKKLVCADNLVISFKLSWFRIIIID